jgi:hypothetical protein
MERCQDAARLFKGGGIMEKRARDIEVEEKRNRWKKHVKDWRNSGMTQAAYCRRHNLSAKSFYYWRKKYSDFSPPTLVPVKFAIHPKRLSNSLSLNIGSRYKIEIHRGFDSETLQQVLSVLNQL